MDRNIWKKTSFIGRSIPQWLCPTCHKGGLFLERESFVKEHTFSARYEQATNGDWEPDWAVMTFGGFLKCLNDNCSELIAFNGIGTLATFDQGQKYEEIFHPRYFVPALQLFKITEGCSDEISTEVICAFSLYWCDQASCANKIRVAVERIMDKEKVKKYHKLPGKKKEKRLNLHDRIELFKVKQPKIAARLLALKWIGNSGSHVGSLTNEQLLDAFELLEDSINKLYDKTEQRLDKLSNQINRKKGPI